MNPQEARERAEQEAADRAELKRLRPQWNREEARLRTDARNVEPSISFGGDERWEIRERHMADQEGSLRTNEYHEQLFR